MRIPQSTSLIAAFGLAFLASAQPPPAVRTNSGFAASTLPKGTGSSTAALDLGFNVNFYGATYTQAFVNHAGNISFVRAVTRYSQQVIRQFTTPMAAVFWADIETSGPNQGQVTYGFDTVNGRRALGVNFLNVGYYPGGADKLNSFQMIMIDAARILGASARAAWESAPKWALRQGRPATRHLTRSTAPRLWVRCSIPTPTV